MSARFIRRQRLGAIPAEAAPFSPRNAVLHGDCIALMAGLPARSVDLVLCDPPYLCGYVDRSGRRVANDTDPAWLVPAFAEVFRVLRDDSYCVSFYGWHQIDRFMSAWRAAGFRPVAHLSFTKRYASSRRFVAARHEMAYVLAKGHPSPPAVPIDDVRDWDYSGNRLHPTQKPVSALVPLIESFCPRVGLVLDPFCGSGSTLVAAKDCGRDWLGIELEAHYCAVARRRLT